MNAGHGGKEFGGLGIWYHSLDETPFLTTLQEVGRRFNSPCPGCWTSGWIVNLIGWNRIVANEGYVTQELTRLQGPSQREEVPTSHALMFEDSLVSMLAEVHSDVSLFTVFELPETHQTKPVIKPVVTEEKQPSIESLRPTQFPSSVPVNVDKSRGVANSATVINALKNKAQPEVPCSDKLVRAIVRQHRRRNWFGSLIRVLIAVSLFTLLAVAAVLAYREVTADRVLWPTPSTAVDSAATR